MSNARRWPLLVILLLVLVSACGGGSGGSGGSGGAGGGGNGGSDGNAPAVVYDGRRGAWTGGDAEALGKTEAALSAYNLIELVDALTLPAPEGPAEFSETLDSPNGGSASLSGRFERDGSGSLTAVFRDYVEDDARLDGKLVQRYGAATVNGRPLTLEFHGLAFEQDNDFDVVLDGTMTRGDNWDFGGDPALLEAELSYRDRIDDETLWLNGLRVRRGQLALQSGGVLRADEISGRVYQASTGYVDVQSESPLVVGNTLPDEPILPASGGPLRIAGAGAPVLMFPLNVNHFAYGPDSNGDGQPDRSQRQSWERLLEGAATSDTPRPVWALDSLRLAAATGQPVTLPGMFSGGGNGLLSIDWSLLLAPPGSVAQLSGQEGVNQDFTPDLPGNYLFAVTASDGTETAVGNVTVIARDVGPATSAVARDSMAGVAARGMDAAFRDGALVFIEAPERAEVGEPVTLDASASHRVETGREPEGLLWILHGPEGSAAALSDSNSAVTRFVPDLPGIYTVTLMPDFVGNPGGPFRLSTNVYVGLDLTFHDPVEYSTHENNGSTRLADVTGDGVPDLVTLASLPACRGGGCARPRLQVYAGHAGGYDRPFEIEVGDAVTPDGFIRTGDFDGTGGVDVAVVLVDRTAIVTGLEREVPELTVIPRAYSCNGYPQARGLFGDVDGDGRRDLVNLNSCDQEAVVRLQDSGGGFGAPIVTSVPGMPWVASADLGDLDGDGYADLAMAADSSPAGVPIVVAMGDGAGGFAVNESYDDPEVGSGIPNYVGIDDVDGDGREDLAARGYSLFRIYRQTDDGRLAEPRIYDPLVQTSFSRIDDGAAFADLNGDGLPDFVLASGFGGVTLGIRRAPGLRYDLIRSPLAFGEPEYNAADRAFPADFNGDGLVDLVAGYTSSSEEGLVVLLGKRR